MMASIESCSTYVHLGTPSRLVGEAKKDDDKANGGKKKPSKEKTKPGKEDEEDPPKKPKVNKKTGVHALITEKMGPLLQVAYEKRLKISQLCDLAGIATSELVPNNKCGSCTVYGNCFYNKCTRVHEKATKEEAEHVIEKLQPLIRDPSLITGQ